MATDPQSLYDQSKCYLCYGLTEAEALELALLAQIAPQQPVSGGFRITDERARPSRFRLTESGDFRIIE